MDLEEIRNEVDENIQEIKQFPDDLDEIASKIYYHLEEEKVNLDKTSYDEILDNIDVNELYQFAKKGLIDNSRRITIELFANKIDPEEANFKLLEVFALDQRPYEIVPLEILSNFKFMDRN